MYNPRWPYHWISYERFHSTVDTVWGYAIAKCCITQLQIIIMSNLHRFQPFLASSLSSIYYVRTMQEHKHIHKCTCAGVYMPSNAHTYTQSLMATRKQSCTVLGECRCSCTTFARLKDKINFMPTNSSATGEEHNTHIQLNYSLTSFVHLILQSS